jgi:hypothetical protein
LIQIKTERVLEGGPARACFVVTGSGGQKVDREIHFL